MVCRLCLTKYDCSIAIFGEERIQQCITRFLQLELTPEDPVSKVICTLCWQHLENFQNFSSRVDEAQKTLKKVNCQLKCEDTSEDTALRCDSNFEPTPLKTECTLSEDETCNDADNSSSHYIGNDIVKVEIFSEEKPNTDVVPPTDNDFFSTRRLTRGAKKRELTSQYEIFPPEPVAKRKYIRRRTTLPEDKQGPTLNSLATKQESVETEKQILVAKKRGRPKKGEQRPKTIKIRSEKSERIQETAREFDEIIKNNMKLLCNICSVNLIDFNELKRHFRSAHNRKGYAVCCNKRLYKRGLVVDHINVHNNPEYFKCQVCGKIMADRMCLRNHTLLLHHNEEDKSYQCAYCPKKYAKQYLLDHHQVKHIPQEECSFFCTECGKGYPTKTTLTQHMNQIHSTIYDKMCEICAKLIRGNAAFERHMEEHEGIVQPQVQCEICGSWLKDKNSLRKHMYKHDGKSYICNECGKVAPSKSALQSHERYVHKAARKFHCTFCEKSFKKAVNLREHLTTHTGEVLYTCPHCPKTFNSKANMHSHRKKKHREEWEANRRYNIKPDTTTEAKPDTMDDCILDNDTF